MRRRGGRRATLGKAKMLARKKVDKVQNAVVAKLAKRLSKLEKVTVERKYVQSFSTFTIGGGGDIKSRSLHRYAVGAYEGMDTFTPFGTAVAQGDRVYARYMIVTVTLQIQPDSLIEGPEHNPTRYQIWLLKPRKEMDFGNDNNLFTNSLNNQNLVTLNVPGQSFVNPKAFKILKYADGILGGYVNANPGYGRAHARYTFKVPLNKFVNLQRGDSVDSQFQWPTEIQDQIFFAISSNGSSVDLEQPSCTISTLLCYDDAGDN